MNESLKKLPNLLAAIAKKRPYLQEFLNIYGNFTLLDYAANFKQSSKAREAFLDRAMIFIQYAAKLAKSLLGTQIADDLKNKLIDDPVILTSDHHGPLSNSLLVNGDLIFALSSIRNKQKVVPVFAFGNVPLNNFTYPRGLVLSEETVDGKHAKVNIFSDKQKLCLVYACDSYNLEMVSRFRSNAESLWKKKVIRQHIKHVVWSFQTLPWSA